MAGPLTAVHTQTAAVRLDVRRLLTMGQNAVLNICTPDKTATGGMRVVRTLSRAFNRMTEEEETSGDGQTVVFGIADVFPAGQLENDLENRPLFMQTVIDGQESEFYPVNDIPRPAESEAQVYVVTCRTRTLARKFFR